MSAFGFNVTDFGARGDGVADDTPAIQAAIDFCAARGGGRILFPYTKKGYRLASPAREEYEGVPVRSQLVIPPGAHNIILEGEMPCALMVKYHIVTKAERENIPRLAKRRDRFGQLPTCNTYLFSDWDAPEEHDPTARPWSMLSAPPNPKTWTAGRFSVRMFSIKNLEFRAKLNTEKMYPTQSCVNLQNVQRVTVADSQFMLSEMVGDTELEKELLPNPCHTAGLVCPADQSDETSLHNVAVQGFRYGLVASEHLFSDLLYCHNCENAVVFHDVSHASYFCHIMAERNRTMITTEPEYLFGMRPGPCNVRIGFLDLEGGHFENGVPTAPAVDTFRCGVYDPGKRLAGEMKWHEPWGKKRFPVVAGEAFKVSPFRPDLDEIELRQAPDALAD